MNKFLMGCAIGALATSSAFAQSTGTDTIENNADAIVVTGSRLSNGVGGVVVPDVPKTRTILTQEFLSHQSSGQSVIAALNQVPGVNFTNTDPYGSSGGNLRIRGFPGNRVALLWDGLPLNDTGNYAIYSNQTQDPEVIAQISVNLGTTDVDSPTPSAAGGVVSYRTVVPTDEMGALFDASVGKFDFSRFFGMFNTGVLTSFGTKAFFSYSDQHYNKFTGFSGDLYKTQFNARVYQPLGSKGDFISIAGHYNRNRNAFYNNGLASDFATNRNFDNFNTCTLTTPGRGTVQNDNLGSGPNGTGVLAAGGANNLANTSSCTNYFGLRINPSNTGNFRGSSRFTITDKLTLTIDPGYQYTLANGGGTTALSETDRRLVVPASAAALTPAQIASGTFGVDLNRDGDRLDTIRLYQPSNTRTNRYTVLSSLIYEVDPSNRLRLAYSWDRGEHRQTGEFGYLDAAGNPINVFGGKYDTTARVLNSDGSTLQNRDRESVALLNQISGEYFGSFFDDRITLTLGLRAPFFERNLQQNCYTQVSTGNPTCGSSVNVLPVGATIVAPNFAGNGTTTAGTLYYAPFSKTIKYSPLLPSAGVTLNISGPHSLYGSYGRNFSAPSTDNLYRSVVVSPVGETTDTFELGYRYRASRIQAQIAAYYTDYKNRIVNAADADPESPTFGTSIDRNVGDATAKGFDALVAFQPTSQVSLSPFVSYIDTEVKNNVVGPNNAILVATAGAEFVETPKWQWGGRADVNFGFVAVGAQWKHVGKRFSTDDNGRTLTAAGTPIVLTNIAGAPVSANGATDGYDTVDIDARISLQPLGMENTFLSFRVDNVFDEYYLGTLVTAATLSAAPRFRVGSPRTWQAQIRFAF